MYAILAGLLIALTTVLGMKLGKSENQPWAYPLVLSLYPLFYFSFALYANDTTAFIQEILYAIPIFFICIVTALKNIKYSAVLLSIGYIGHGVYDIIHQHLFINSGMPIWWPEFCGTVDITIGLYLLVFAIKLPNKSIVYSANA